MSAAADVRRIAANDTPKASSAVYVLLPSASHAVGTIHGFSDVEDVMRPASLVLLCSVMLFAGAGSALAQFDTASVVGTVRDQSAAPVPGAKVTLTNTATGVSVTKTTSSDGNYEFVTVKAGVYIVTAEMTGFSIALTENVQVQVGAR